MTPRTNEPSAFRPEESPSEESRLPNRHPGEGRGPVPSPIPGQGWRLDPGLAGTLCRDDGSRFVRQGWATDCPRHITRGAGGGTPLPKGILPLSVRGKGGRGRLFPLACLLAILVGLRRRKEFGQAAAAGAGAGGGRRADPAAAAFFGRHRTGPPGSPGFRDRRHHRRAGASARGGRPAAHHRRRRQSAGRHRAGPPRSAGGRPAVRDERRPAGRNPSPGRQGGAGSGPRRNALRAAGHPPCPSSKAPAPPPNPPGSGCWRPPRSRRSPAAAKAIPGSRRRSTPPSCAAAPRSAPWRRPALPFSSWPTPRLLKVVFGVPDSVVGRLQPGQTRCRFPPRCWPAPPSPAGCRPCRRPPTRSRGPSRSRSRSPIPTTGSKSA